MVQDLEIVEGVDILGHCGRLRLSLRLFALFCFPLFLFLRSSRLFIPSLLLLRIPFGWFVLFHCLFYYLFCFIQIFCWCDVLAKQ